MGKPRLQFSNRYVFAKVMQDNPDLCREMLERTLGSPSSASSPCSSRPRHEHSEEKRDGLARLIGAMGDSGCSSTEILEVVKTGVTDELLVKCGIAVASDSRTAR